MKIYTNTFDLAYPSPCRFWVAPNSDFKIGIKIEDKGTSYAGDFVLKQNGEVISPDEGKVAGFTTYTLKSLGTGSVIYTIEAADAQQKFTLVQVTTDSTVFDVGSGGGDVPADVATQSWVNAQISSFVEEDDLTAYATKDDISAFIAEIPANLSAETLQIKNGNYTVISACTGSEIDSGALLVNGPAAEFRVGPAQTTGSVRINSNGTTPSIEGGKGIGQEAAYSLSCDTSGHGILTLNTTTLNATELQSMKDLSGNVYAKADTLSSSAYGTATKLTGMQAVYESAWETLSATADASTFYVVLPDPA